MQPMIMLRSLRLHYLILLGLLAVASTLAACGGSSAVVFKPGPLVCDTLATESYHYRVQATQEVDAMEGTPPPSTRPFLGPLMFNETIEGDVAHGTELQVTVDNGTGGVDDTIFQALQLDGNVGYLNYNDGAGWRKQDNTSLRSLPIRYRPPDLCNALAPDIDTSTLGTPQAETVNGIDSQRFAISGLPTQFFAREPDFGGGSDAAANLHSLDGTIWVANSGYISKMDITAAGQYPNGQPTKIRLTFEVSAMGTNVDLKAPS